uniref:Ubiquitin-like domain-containing protein n=1 Tax=Solanum lycopersicum TaxID=4081 RepID=A0A3Q7JDV7_SOLLC
MNLVIQILTGTLFHIRVAKDESVANLKKEISKQENLPENRLILTLDTGHGESIMLNDDEISLVDYGVKDGSHFYLFFKLHDTNNSNNGENSNGDDVSFVNPETPVSREDSVTFVAK